MFRQRTPVRSIEAIRIREVEIKMNKTKLRWDLYRILVKKRGVLRGKRGGFSLAFLYEFVFLKYKLELEIFGDPVKAIKELTYA